MGLDTKAVDYQDESSGVQIRFGHHAPCRIRAIPLASKKSRKRRRSVFMKDLIIKNKFYGYMENRFADWL